MLLGCPVLQECRAAHAVAERVAHERVRRSGCGRRSFTCFGAKPKPPARRGPAGTTPRRARDRTVHRGTPSFPVSERRCSRSSRSSASSTSSISVFCSRIRRSARCRPPTRTTRTRPGRRRGCGSAPASAPRRRWRSRALCGASPRSCSQASNIIRRPEAPIGWPNAFRPPSGLTGSSPSRSKLPASTSFQPCPRSAKPRSSISTSSVGVKQSWTSASASSPRGSVMPACG